MKLNYDILYDGIRDRSSSSPIILLHAMGENRKSWKKVGPIIARRTGRKAYSLDARNHGESPRCEEMDYDIMAKDIVEFMDDHKIEKAIIIGHSMGGRTAITFALEHPERTEALVVEDMSPRNIKSADSFSSGLFEFVNQFFKTIPVNLDLMAGRNLVLECMLDFGGEKFADPEKMRKHYDLDYMPVLKNKDSFFPESNMEAIKMMVKSDTLVQDLPKRNLTYDGDALFLYGDLGFFKLDKDPTVKKLFPRAIIKKVKGASHWMHHDSPDDFVDIVSSFVLNRYLQESKL